jgi:hypothetical protein
MSKTFDSSSRPFSPDRARRTVEVDCNPIERSARTQIAFAYLCWSMSAPDLQQVGDVSSISCKAWFGSAQIRNDVLFETSSPQPAKSTYARPEQRPRFGSRRPHRHRDLESCPRLVRCPIGRCRPPLFVHAANEKVTSRGDRAVVCDDVSGCSYRHADRESRNASCRDGHSGRRQLVYRDRCRVVRALHHLVDMVGSVSGRWTRHAGPAQARPHVGTHRRLTPKKGQAIQRTITGTTPDQLAWQFTLWTRARPLVH